jgi:hypothetical protein
LLANTTRHLIVYYFGHGTTTHDVDHTLPRTKDEAFILAVGAVDDEEFLEALEAGKHPKTGVALVTDTCGCDTAWHIHDGEIKGHKLPPGVMTVSSCRRVSTSGLIMQRRESQGIFRLNLTKEFKGNPKKTPKQLKDKMTAVKAEFAEVFSVG